MRADDVSGEYAVLIDDGSELGRVASVHGNVSFTRSEAQQIARSIGPQAQVVPLGTWVSTH